jgi:hypothetical protein
VSVRDGDHPAYDPGKEFGDDFHQLWRAAQARENDFLPIFLPWSIDPGYRAKAPDDFTATADESHAAGR